MRRSRILLTAVLLLGLWTAAAAPALAQGNQSDFLRTNPRFVENFREVVAGPSEFTVRIRADGKDAALGVIVGEDGWVLTKAFSLKGKIVCRLKDGRELEAKIAGVQSVHDLALLKIDAAGLTA